MTYKIHIGNNLDILPTLEDNSIDSIVTDPPYELGFMGKKWDSSGIAYSVELWAECLRVLKPGGHLLSFGGTRTWHRVAVAIEDAGFEVRDSIAWMYGSGFPKSLDISKAIDKSDAAEARRKRDLEFTAWMRSTGITATQINELTDSSMASHYLTDKQQPSVATAELFDKLRPYLPEVPDYIEKMVAERTIESQNFKNRKKVGESVGAQAQSTGRFGAWGNDDGTGKSKFDITESHTPEAQQWEGWGTALKPAFEPIVVARKPLIGTVAANVLEHGTGGLNIDGSRIGTTDNLNGGAYAKEGTSRDDGWGMQRGQAGEYEQPAGRWPANVILDPYTAELLDEQSGTTKSSQPSGSINYGAGTDTSGNAILGRGLSASVPNVAPYGDSGGASRFFYVAKASKRDRNEGLEKLPTKGKVFNGQNPESAGMAEGSVEDKFTTQPAQNFHPTVKPTALMRYLVKLVTPPGGVVLDPFTGSGSTGKAAILEGFEFVGIELTEDYIPIIEGRLKHAEQTVVNENKGLF